MKLCTMHKGNLVSYRKRRGVQALGEGGYGSGVGGAHYKPVLRGVL